ncbi:hypothetical protein QP519_00055 [Weeksella virosa]|uniref:hypothetical protein n=1 Tax=Weeksella virosa TaxID=1014 RepID=UPI0025535B43|nr:hypothetical protein [Weeksella virosa]MDK7373943.1 hypothetical protein [Weeksella virosa]
MKKIIYTAFLMLFSVSWAQVGINTDQPTRDLHVEGDLRVRDLQNKSEVSAYDKVLAADKDGNIDYIDKEILKPDLSGQTDKIVQNNLYYTTNGRPDNTKTLTCGKFEFAFIREWYETVTYVKFRLTERPQSTVNIYITFEQNYPAINTADGFQYEASATSTKNFTTSNWNRFQSIPTTTSQGEIADGEYNELYVIYPNIGEFYRVTFYRLLQNEKSYFVNTCEQF